MVELIINGQRADIFEGREFPLSIDIQIDDALSFTDKRGASGSRTFRLPGTACNDAIFSHFDAAQVDAGLVCDAMPAEIRLDSVPVEVGVVYLQSVKLVADHWSRRAREYEVIFLADAAEWFDLLAGRTLRALSFSTFTLGFAAIAALENVTAASSDYCFTLIKWKRWRDELSGHIDRDEYTPALFIKRIIDEAFGLIGYTINSSFFNTDFFERLILPIPPRPGYGADFFRDFIDATATLATPQTGLSVTTTVIFNDETTPPNFDNGGQYDHTSGVFTAPYNGVYSFRYEATLDNITVSSLQPSFAAAFLKNGSVLVPASPFFFAPLANGDTVSALVEVQLQQGDTIEAAVSPAANVTSFDITGGVFDIRTHSLQWAYGLDLYWSYMVPEWSLLDLIKGVAAMFNLKFATDSAARVVTIEPRDDFYNSTADKTAKIDILKEATKSPPDIAGAYVFSYKGDSNDPNLDELSNGQPIVYAGGEYTTKRTTGDTVEIKNPFFAPTAHLRDSTIAGFDGNDTPPQIPIIYPEVFGEPNVTENKYNQEPRVLYFAGTTGQSAGGSAPSKYGSVSLLSASPSTRSTYPLSFMVNYYDDGGVFPSLLYGDTTVAGNVERPGLLRQYYLAQLATINRGATLEEFAVFNIADLLALNFRERWRILGDVYLLQKISGHKMTRQESTKILLIENHCPTDDDLDRLDGSPAQGVING